MTVPKKNWLLNMEADELECLGPGKGQVTIVRKSGEPKSEAVSGYLEGTGKIHA